MQKRFLHVQLSRSDLVIHYGPRSSDLALVQVFCCGWVHKNFRDMVDTYNSDGSTEDGATPVYSSNIPDLATFKCPKTCTLEHYLNKRDIKENCDWVKSSSLMTFIPAPLAAGIIKAGVQYTKNQK